MALIQVMPAPGRRARLSSLAVRGAISAESVEHAFNLQLGLARFVHQYLSTKRDRPNCQVETRVRPLPFRTFLVNTSLLNTFHLFFLLVQGFRIHY